MPTEYSALSDSELSRLVAERVMGEREPEHPENWYHVKDTAAWRWVPSDQGSEAHWEPFPFASEMGQAWRVVERLRFSGRSFTLEIHQSVYASFRNGIDSVHCMDDSAPRAICIAALRAVEEG